MPIWAQHVVVFVIVAMSVATVARSAIRQLLGGCRACGGCRTPESRDTGKRVVFLPADLLTRRR